MAKEIIVIRNLLFFGLCLIQLSCSSKSIYLIKQEATDPDLGEIVIERKGGLSASGMKAYVVDQTPNLNRNALIGSVKIGSLKQKGEQLFLYYPRGLYESSDAITAWAITVTEPDLSQFSFRYDESDARKLPDNRTVDGTALDKLLEGSNFQIIRNDFDSFSSQIKRKPSVRHKTKVRSGVGTTDVFVSLDSATTIGIVGTDEPLSWKRPAGTAHVFIILNSFAATYVDRYEVEVQKGETTYYELSSSSDANYPKLRRQTDQ